MKLKRILAGFLSGTMAVTSIGITSIPASAFTATVVGEETVIASLLKEPITCTESWTNGRTDEEGINVGYYGDDVEALHADSTVYLKLTATGIEEAAAEMIGEDWFWLAKLYNADEPENTDYDVIFQAMDSSDIEEAISYVPFSDAKLYTDDEGVVSFNAEIISGHSNNITIQSVDLVRVTETTPVAPVSDVDIILNITDHTITRTFQTDEEGNEWYDGTNWYINFATGIKRAAYKAGYSDYKEYLANFSGIKFTLNPTAASGNAAEDMYAFDFGVFTQDIDWNWVNLSYDQYINMPAFGYDYSFYYPMSNFTGADMRSIGIDVYNYKQGETEGAESSFSYTATATLCIDEPVISNPVFSDYNVSVEAVEGFYGVDDFDMENGRDFMNGQDVSLVLRPQSGYKVIGATVTAADGTAIEAEYEYEQYSDDIVRAVSFTMPAQNVTVIPETEFRGRPVRAISTGNGTVEVDSGYAAANGWITATLTPDGGYLPENVYVTYGGTPSISGFDGADGAADGFVAIYDEIKGIDLLTKNGISATDVYGVRFTVKGQDSSDGTWLGGGIGVNSDIGGWVSYGWGGVAESVAGVADNGTLTLLTNAPLFTGEEEFMQFWLQNWSDTPIAITDVEVLGKGGKVLFGDSAGEETYYTAVFGDCTYSYSDNSLFVVEVTEDISVLNAEIYLNKDEYAGCVFNPWTSHGIKVNHANNTYNVYSWGGSQVTWDWYESDNPNKGVNSENWLTTVPDDYDMETPINVAIPVQKGDVVEFRTYAFDWFDGAQYAVKIDGGVEKVNPGKTLYTAIENDNRAYTASFGAYPSDMAVIATFAEDPGYVAPTGYIVEVENVEGFGSMNNVPYEGVAAGETVEAILSAAPGYQIVGATVTAEDGTEIEVEYEYKQYNEAVVRTVIFTMPEQNVTITPVAEMCYFAMNGFSTGGGIVFPDPYWAASGSEVNFTVIPDEGYEVDSIQLKYSPSVDSISTFDEVDGGSDGRIALVDDVKGIDLFAKNNIKASDVYGVRVKLGNINAQALADAWYGGAIVGNSESNDWDQHSFGNEINDTTELAIGEDGVITYLSSKPMFSDGDSYINVFVSNWATAFVLSEVDLLDKNGDVLFGDSTGVETYWTSNFRDCMFVYDYGTSYMVEVADDVDVLNARIYINEDSYEGYIFNAWTGNGVRVNHADGTSDHYQWGGERVDWDWISNDNENQGINGEYWLGTTTGNMIDLEIPVQKGDIVEFVTLGWESYQGVQYTVKIDSGIKAVIGNSYESPDYTVVDNGDGTYTVTTPAYYQNMALIASFKKGSEPQDIVIDWNDSIGWVHNGKYESISSAIPGSVVELHISTWVGYQSDKIIVTDLDGNVIESENIYDGDYLVGVKFTMPDSKVIISNEYSLRDYDLILQSGLYSNITSETSTFNMGEKVTVKVNPVDGYVIDEINVYRGNNSGRDSQSAIDRYDGVADANIAIYDYEEFIDSLEKYGYTYKDIYGLRVKYDISAEELSDPDAWIGGSIGSNSDTRGWNAIEWGKETSEDKKPVILGTDGVVEWLLDEPVFTEDDTYMQLWAQVWGGTATILEMDVLGKGGKVLFGDSVAKEGEYNENTHHCRFTSNGESSFTVKVTEDVDTLTAKFSTHKYYDEDEAYDGLVVTLPDGTKKGYIIASSTWAAQNQTYAQGVVIGGVKTNEILAVAPSGKATLSIPVEKGATVDFYCVTNDYRITINENIEVVVDADEIPHKITKNEDGTYTVEFTATAEDVTISVEASPEGADEYAVAIAESSNVTVTADKAVAGEGETVTVTIVPATGFKFDSVSVKTESGAAVVADVVPATVNDGKYVYSFIMPAENVTVSATVKAPTREEQISDFVERLYTIMLNRASEPEGKKSHVDGLLSGKTAAEIAEGFVLGEELKVWNITNEEFVRRMYLTFLNREADPEGLAVWTAVLDKGCSYGRMFRDFCNSAEFKIICDSYGISQGSYAITEARDINENITHYCSRMYTKALGRAYDVNGLNNWAEALVNGTETPESVAMTFLNGPEFRIWNHSDEVFVDRLYETLFNRPADPEGKQTWLNLLAVGTTREEAIATFVQSQEFTLLKASLGL